MGAGVSDSQERGQETSPTRSREELQVAIAKKKAALKEEVAGECDEAVTLMLRGQIAALRWADGEDPQEIKRDPAAEEYGA